MSRTSGMLCYWPGLVALWRFGRPGGLLTAVAFALLLNGAIVAAVMVPEQVPHQVRYLLWFVVLVFWWWSSKSSQRMAGGAPDQAVVELNQGLFLQAQAEYLKGHWFEAEAPLRQILKTDPDDTDARLLLVGLLRRSARHDEARRQLKRLAKMPHARKWEAEIKREFALLPAPNRPAIARGILAGPEKGPASPEVLVEPSDLLNQESDSGRESGQGDAGGSEGYNSEDCHSTDYHSEDFRSDEDRSENRQGRKRRAA